jgi:hypothetical protein
MHFLIYFGIFYSACLAQWIVLKRMITQVNQYLSDGEQFPTSLWAISPRTSRAPINQIRIWRLHRQLFPESYLPWLYLAIWALIILSSLLCVQFDRSHSIAHRE